MVLNDQSIKAYRPRTSINSRRRIGAVSTVVLWSVLAAPVSFAGEFKYKLEAKLNYRDSDENRFATKFPFPPSFLPVGETSAFLETVDAGSHSEISAITFAGIWDINDALAFHFKADAIDKYDRNPTSEDRKFDMDHYFLRYTNTLPGSAVGLPSNYYMQIGKFAKFERQVERRTESYGLISTSFNRFEDSGIEAGINLASGFYGKLSYTTGNPVFLRDPNALAGDNGTSDRRAPPDNPDPDLKSGVVLLYDAEIEDFDLTENPETGIALGYKWQKPDRSHMIDVMAFGYERDLGESVSLHGTFYGADLDLLDLGDVAGAGGIRLPVEGKRKKEAGLNVKYHWQNMAVFAQYVQQDVAELARDGYEIELSYAFDGPITVTPVIRYSRLDTDFVGEPRYPAPSVWWDWERIDYALNFRVTDNVEVIAEYSDNEFLVNGRWQSNDEFLLTVRLSIGS